MEPASVSAHLPPLLPAKFELSNCTSDIETLLLLRYDSQISFPLGDIFLSIDKYLDIFVSRIG